MAEMPEFEDSLKDLKNSVNEQTMSYLHYQIHDISRVKELNYKLNYTSALYPACKIQAMPF